MNLTINTTGAIKKFLVIILLSIALLVPIIVKNQYYLHLIIQSYIASILCVGWVLIFKVGQFSIGQVAFYAIGAYAFALLAKELTFPLFFAFVLSGIIAAVFAFIIGMVILRIKGLYFAVLTLAFAEIVRLIIISWESLLGGFNGISGIPRPILGGIDWSSKIPYYYFILILTFLTFYFTYFIYNSRLFLLFRAVASNENLAESLGVHLMRYRILAFGIAAFFSGLAGAFYASYAGLVHPDCATVWESINVQIKSTIGGTVNIISGPLLGGIFMTLFGDILHSYAPVGFENLLFGGLLLVIIFFIPGGLDEVFRKVLNLKR
jgi:branched-chain amino acid transport system permease protein